jgi:hypothetical protein
MEISTTILSLFDTNGQIIQYDIIPRSTFIHFLKFPFLGHNKR